MDWKKVETRLGGFKSQPAKSNVTKGFRPLAVFRLYSLVLLGQPAVDTPGTEKETSYSGVTWTADGVEVGLLCCVCSVLLKFEDHTREIYEGVLNIYPPCNST